MAAAVAGAAWLELMLGRLKSCAVTSPTGAAAAGLELAACIGTHNGHFHCDEATACGMLHLLDEFQTTPVVRTRDSAALEQCAVVVDVGGTYDADTKRFDHHQRDFQDVFFSASTKTKLSSAGLVYKHFGREIIARIGEGTTGQRPSDAVVGVVFDKVYLGFVEHIDGIDNGVNAFTGDKLYTVSTHLSARVGALNPGWNDTDVSEATEMERFRAAMLLATTEFVQHVQRLFSGWLPAREIVEAAIAARADVDASGELLKFASPCPWKSHLFDLEAEAFDGVKPGQLKYALYPDSNGAWRVQCVSAEEHSFENRLSLPEKFRGLRDDALSEACGIPGCIFVHAAGFIGANKTYDGALAMAMQSLDLAKK